MDKKPKTPQKKIENCPSSISSALKSQNLIHNPYSSPVLKTCLYKKLSLKKSPSSKEKKHLIIYQSEEIAKLKQENQKLQALVTELRSQIRKNTTNPNDSKGKDIKNTESSKKLKGRTKKTALSLRSSPVSLFELPKGDNMMMYTKNKSRFSSSQPNTKKNSCIMVTQISLNDVIKRTEEILLKWEKAYCFKKLAVR